MSKKQAAVPAGEKPIHPAVEAMRDLFVQLREGPEEKRDITAGRKIERQAAKLAAEVAASAPNSKDHAEALQTHEYILLSLSRTTKSKKVSQSFLDAGYAKGAEAVAILLQQDKPDLGTCFSAYNLAIDLICTENRPQEGLGWMLKSSALLKKLAGKKKLPSNILMFKLFSQDYGIAKAYYDLGQKEKAKRILKRALRQAGPLNKASWSDLRGIAKAAELLAQIRLDELDAKRVAKAPKAA